MKNQFAEDLTSPAEQLRIVNTEKSNDLSAGVWHAFRAAIEEAKSVFRSAVAKEDLLPFLNSLEDSVRCVVAGLPAKPASPAASISTTQVLDCVRRRFVDEVYSGKVEDSQEAIHVLSALGRVQVILDLAGPERTPELLAGRDPAALLIEIAHDMRSPLAAILFLLDMLRTKRSGPVTPIQEQQLRLIYSASLGVMQLSCDLIDSVRGAERMAGERPTDFSITETFRAVKDIVQPMAEEKNVELVFVHPAADARKGAPTALNRILLNLTTNAIKFSGPGVVTVSAVEVGDSSVEFSVQDSGREIPAQVMKQIFRPFRKSDSRRTRTFSSTGLGLSICHKLVMAMGSELQISTTPNQGTRFFFRVDLPVAAESR